MVTLTNDFCFSLPFFLPRYSNPVLEEVILGSISPFSYTKLRRLDCAYDFNRCNIKLSKSKCKYDSVYSKSSNGKEWNRKANTLRIRG
jgi:hypothetical protein